MDRGRREVNRILERERRHTQEEIRREIDKLTKASDREVKRLRAEARNLEAEYESKLRALDRELRDARGRMEREASQSLERQRQSVERELAALRNDLTRRINAEAAALSESLGRQYRELDARVREQEDITREMIEAEYRHAKATLDAAAAALEEARKDETLLRFGALWLDWLENLFNAAVQEYNAGYPVPADGQAAHMIAQCDRCRREASEFSKTWQQNHGKALALWQQCADALAVMDKPIEISAANNTIEGVRMSAWDPEGWQGLSDRLENCKRILDAPQPCSLEEIGMAATLLTGMREPIEQETARVMARIVNCLYLQYLMECIQDKLWEEYGEETWDYYGPSVMPIDNTAHLLIASRSADGQRIAVDATEMRESGVLRFTIENDTFDAPRDRTRFLDRMLAGLTDTLNGVDAVLVQFLRQWRFSNGSAVCVGFDCCVPEDMRDGARIRFPETDAEDTREEAASRDNDLKSQKGGLGV